MEQLLIPLQCVDSELQNICAAPSYVSMYENKYVIAKIISVYDGDTCDAIFKLTHDMGYYTYKIRLLGIDTPEIKPHIDIPNRELIIANAKRARDFIIQHTANKLVTLQLFGLDKYGRILGKIYLPDNHSQCLNTLLIDMGYAYEYNGGTKKTPRWIITTQPHKSIVSTDTNTTAKPAKITII